ncbi:MAG TPA: hypothetical protein VIJ21_01540, partial [Solirubrobacterales bacterium]
MSADRPINADVGPPEEAPEPPPAPKSAPGQPKLEAEPHRTAEPPPVPRRRRRSRIPGPIKLVAVLVLIAIGFIVLAVFGGSGSKKGDKGAASTTSPTVGVTASAGEGSSSEDEGEGEGEGDPGGAGAEELGYPTFATSNTTRIGGPDPVANAAAAALAVFPATNEKQRPVAVSLVGAEDWAGAIAASVLMAEPVGAPLLYGEAEGVPDPTAEALESLQPSGGAASGGAAVLAIGKVKVPGGMSAAKVAAGDAATE